MLVKALSALACIGSSLLCHAAILNVTSLEDSGPGTLRDALLVAESQDRIVFSSNLTGLIHLETPLPALNREIEILGPLSGSVAIDSSGSFDVFYVGKEVSIENLALNLGEAPSRKSIVIEPMQGLKLNNVTVNHCSEGDESAIEIFPEGELIASNLLFSSPSSSGTDINFHNDCSAKLAYDEGVETSIRMRGAGSMSKNGLGTLHVSSSQDPIQMLFFVEEGIMTFTGTAARRVAIGLQGVLQGGNYDTLANAGTFQPSKTPGTAASTKIAEDYIQGISGNAILQIFPDGRGDQIHLGGTASIYGTLTIHAVDGNYLPGTEYTLFTAEGGINGQFANVSLSKNIQARVDYLPNAVVLTITH